MKMTLDNNQKACWPLLTIVANEWSLRRALMIPPQFTAAVAQNAEVVARTDGVIVLIRIPPGDSAAQADPDVVGTGGRRGADELVHFVGALDGGQVRVRVPAVGPSFGPSHELRNVVVLTEEARGEDAAPWGPTSFSFRNTKWINLIN